MKKILLFAFFSLPLFGETDVQELLVKGVQEKPETFQKIEVNGTKEAVDFSIQLGESQLKIKEDAIFDGFRFTAPEGAEELDFVWYFTAPEGWQGWYLCPVEGEFKMSFRNWLDGDKVYQSFDEGGFEGRLRILQTLDKGYFESGKEYVMWFSQQGLGKNGKVKGRFRFVTPSEDPWKHDAIEEALALKPLAADKQVEALQSRGGQILLDSDFFTKDYASGRIDSAFFTLRQTKQVGGGFFITMKISIPSCKTEPPIADIIARHGTADFIQTSKEARKITEHQGGQLDEDWNPNLTTYYYDYFGFEVVEGKVIRVTSQANNFSNLKGEEENSFGHLSMKNLTTFYQGKKEVGRIIQFREAGKEVLIVAEPPIGTYRRGSGSLEYLGNGKWKEISYYDDRSIARQLFYEENLLSGRSRGFYKGGKKRFEADYLSGVLHGQLLEYGEDGALQRRRNFKDGEVVEP